MPSKLIQPWKIVVGTLTVVGLLIGILTGVVSSQTSPFKTHIEDPDHAPGREYLELQFANIIDDLTYIKEILDRGSCK